MKTALVLATLGSLVAAEAAAQQAGDRIGWNSGNRSGDPAVVERIAALIVETNPDPSVRAVGRSGVSQSGAAITGQRRPGCAGRHGRGDRKFRWRAAQPRPGRARSGSRGRHQRPPAPETNLPSWFTRQTRRQ